MKCVIFICPLLTSVSFLDLYGFGFLKDCLSPCFFFGDIKEDPDAVLLEAGGVDGDALHEVPGRVGGAPEDVVTGLLEHLLKYSISELILPGFCLKDFLVGVSGSILAPWLAPD